MKTLPAHLKTHNGFEWAFDDDDGAHIYIKKTTTGYLKMRCLDSDMTNGNFEYMADKKLTNNNPVPKVADKRYTINREFMGKEYMQWVVRFEGDYVAAHHTKKEANGCAVLHRLYRQVNITRGF